MKEQRMKTSAINSMLHMHLNLIENSKNSIGKLKIGQKCENCSTHILQTSQLVNGVIQAKWDTISEMLIVEYNSAKSSLKRIELAISEAGHDTPNFSGRNNYYSLMPQCCQYNE